MLRVDQPNALGELVFAFERKHSAFPVVRCRSQFRLLTSPHLADWVANHGSSSCPLPQELERVRRRAKGKAGARGETWIQMWNSRPYRINSLKTCLKWKRPHRLPSFQCYLLYSCPWRPDFNYLRDFIDAA